MITWNDGREGGVGNGDGVGEGTKAEATGDRVVLEVFTRKGFSMGLMLGFVAIRKCSGYDDIMQSNPELSSSPLVLSYKANPHQESI
jgi:hypothetical protein